MVAAHPSVHASLTFKRRQHCPVDGCKYAEGGATLRHSASLLDHFGLTHQEDADKQIMCSFIVEGGEECTVRCGTTAELRDHKRSKHNTGTFECVACPGTSFRSKKLLDKHVEGLNQHAAEGYKKHGRKAVGKCSRAYIPLDARPTAFHS